MLLPEAFENRMRELLQEQFDPFMESYQKPHYTGLRWNPLKTDLKTFLEIIPCSVRPVLWAEEGFYYHRDERPGKHVLHEAGLYYIQEPSAMAVVSLLDPKPGEKILDLCAAPGGKTTQIGGRLRGQGLLLSNEIHPARAKILSQNVERMGMANCVVVNEVPERLPRYFPQFFDGIVVDAPCSGEGMFRKDPQATEQWSQDHILLCAKRQQQILGEAAAMLKPGGRLVYSTCTFAPEENEQTIDLFLTEHPEFSVVIQEGTFPDFDRGRREWCKSGRVQLSDTFRIWPHHTEGEGHYMALLVKESRPGQTEKTLPFPNYCRDGKLLADYMDFLKRELKPDCLLQQRREFLLYGEQLYLVPPDMVNFDGLRVLRPGLHLGTCKKNRFEPSFALALHLSPDQVFQWYELEGQESQSEKYVKGETIIPTEGNACSIKEKGWVLLTTRGCSIGFGKLSGGVIKNHFPKGLRWV